MSSPIKFLLIAVALGAGFFADDLYQAIKDKLNRPSLNEYCLLSTQTCVQDEIKVTLNRDVSQPLIPTQMSVEWPSAQSNELYLTMEGHEMEMGTVIFKLQKDSKGLFTGEVVLPVCTTEAMTWVGELSDGQHTMKTSIRMER